MITRHSKNNHRKYFIHQTLVTEIRDDEQKKTTYVPLQTREHAWAGMSGMLHFGGARGAFYVPRR